MSKYNTFREPAPDETRSNTQPAASSKQHCAKHPLDANDTSGTSPTGVNQPTASPSPTPHAPAISPQDAPLPLNPTFEDLCALDPRLRTLCCRIAASKSDPRVRGLDRLWLWFGYGDAKKQPYSFKNDLCEIVGVAVPGEYRAHPFLATSKAYEIVYRTLFAVLMGRRDACGEVSNGND